MKPAVAVLVFLVCATASAQEFDIFDANDFIDPRERGAVFTSGRIGTVKPGNPFYIVRLYGGQVRSYQWRGAATHADPAFIHAAASFFRADKQLNVKVTTFKADENANLPSFRTTLQLGQYFLSDRENPKLDHPRIANRILVTWSMEQNPFRDDPGSTHRTAINHEFGVETDIQIANVDGAFIWMRRRIDEHEYVDRVSYLYRFRERLRSNGRLHLAPTFGFSAERANGWKCCVARGILTATYIIPRIDTGFNVAFAPTWSPSTADGRRVNYEFAVYLDRTVLVQLRDIAAR
ncbi:MAG TPA: hypothetical protein VMU84_00710 [Thermoanaerobaculia bacterium]|nr:hypothetical protein [Thermoanaerobaculia bacterium]